MKFDGKLEEFSKSLALPNFESQARSAVKDISEALKTSKYTFDRCRLVGGLGKKTSTSVKPDADIAVFYNDKDVNKEYVVQELRQILNSKENVTNMLPGGYGSNTIQFTFNEEVPVDLVVARNYANESDGEDTASKQMNNSIKIVRQHGDHPKSVSDLGAETTESSLQFMKSKGPFVNSVARLCKYWSQAIFFKEYVYGKSLIFELLATKAALMEETKNKPGSIYNGFKTYLELIYNIKKQDIVFEDYYKRSEIPVDIQTQRPLLMDPTNPYNNLLESKKDNLNKLFDVFTKCADHTLDILKKGSEDIQELFFPQRLLLTQCEHENLVKPKNYQIGVCQVKGKNPPLKPTCILNADGNKFRHYFQALLFSYAAFVYNLSKSKEKKSKEITNAVKELVDKVNGNKGLWTPRTGTYNKDWAFEWVQTGDSFHGRAVTLQIPMEDKNVLILLFDYDER